MVMLFTFWGMATEGIHVTKKFATWSFFFTSSLDLRHSFSHQAEFISVKMTSIRFSVSCCPWGEMLIRKEVISGSASSCQGHNDGVCSNLPRRQNYILWSEKFGRKCLRRGGQVPCLDLKNVKARPCWPMSNTFFFHLALCACLCKMYVCV